MKGSFRLLLGGAPFSISRARAEEVFRRELCDRASQEIRLPPGLHMCAVLAFSEGVNGFSAWGEVKEELMPQVLGLVLHLCRKEAQKDIISRIGKDAVEKAIYDFHSSWDLGAWQLLAFLYKNCSDWSRTLEIFGKGKLNTEKWEAVKEFKELEDPYDLKRIVVCLRTKAKVELKLEQDKGDFGNGPGAIANEEPSTSVAAYGSTVNAPSPPFLENGHDIDMSNGLHMELVLPGTESNKDNEPVSLSTSAVSFSPDHMSRARTTSEDSGTVSGDGMEVDLIRTEESVTDGEVSDNDNEDDDDDCQLMDSELEQSHESEGDNEVVIVKVVKRTPSTSTSNQIERLGLTQRSRQKERSTQLINKRNQVQPTKSPDARSRSPRRRQKRATAPKDGSELKKMVAEATPGTIIRLLPNTNYNLCGTLIIRVPKLRILGAGWNSSKIIGAKSHAPIITVEESAVDCSLSNFEIRSDHLFGKNMRAGLYLRGGRSLVKKLRICNSSLFIWSSGNKVRDSEVAMLGPNNMSKIGISLEFPQQFPGAKKFKDRPDRNLFKGVVIKDFKYGIYVDPELEWNRVEGLRTENVLYGITLDGANKNSVQRFRYTWSKPMPKAKVLKKRQERRKPGAVQILGGKGNRVERVSCKVRGWEKDFYCVKVGEEGASGKPQGNEVVDCAGPGEFIGMRKYETAFIKWE